MPTAAADRKRSLWSEWHRFDTNSGPAHGYTWVMGRIGRRTHVILTDRQHAFLGDEANRTGLSMGELVRRAIDATYRPHERPRLNGLEVSLGVWKRPDAALAGRRPPRI